MGLRILDLFKAFFLSEQVLDAHLYTVYKRMSLIDKLLFHVVHFVDRYCPWHKLPVILGAVYLVIRRSLHQRYNLINVGGTPTGVRYNAVDVPYRTNKGDYNDPFSNESGDKGSFFGRNVKPVPQMDQILDPHPSVVATKLLARRKLVDTGKQFNMLAASWIQFMIHDWADHLEDTQQMEIKAPSSVAAECPLKVFKFNRTKEDETGFYDIKTGHRNIRTAWWDGSVIYGNDDNGVKKVRTFKDGKIKIGNDGLLQHTSDGVPIAGDVRNSWAGVSILQALFIKEHNTVCDLLKKKHPNFGDDDLYRHARLVVAAVIAKIHTIDWTVELLKMDTLYAGMRANWYGLLGKKFKDTFGHTGSSLLSGFVGMSKPENHGVPYSLTEEFVGVYRLHSLLPEEVLLRNLNGKVEEKKTPPISKLVPMKELSGLEGEKTLSSIGNDTMLVSLGHQACGALVLFNYPNWMRDLIAQDSNAIPRPDHVDLAALEIYRDRERGVARFNEFRRNMMMIPIRKWEDLNDDPEVVKVLREVYGNDVEKLDLLVGLMAEKKIKGFAISETAFFIFLLMATRRLEADRFFTSEFNEDVYTKEGLAWVNSTESLKDVIKRHYSSLESKWLNAPSAFSVWSAQAPPESHIPVLLRVP